MLQYNPKNHSDLVEESQWKSKKENQYKIANGQRSTELEFLNETADDIFEPPTNGYSDFAIRMKNFSAKWDKSIPENCLNEISIEIKKNTLTAIIGPVGAGKVDSYKK